MKSLAKLLVITIIVFSFCSHTSYSQVCNQIYVPTCDAGGGCVYTGTITMQGTPPVWAGVSVTLQGQGWSCPPNRECFYTYYWPGPNGTVSSQSALFTGNSLQPSWSFIVPPQWTAPIYNGLWPCKNYGSTTNPACYGDIEHGVYISQKLPDGTIYGLSQLREISIPCYPEAPITIYQPTQGAALNDQCSVQIIGTKKWSSGTTVDISVDGSTPVTVPVDANGYFSTTATILTGSHTVTASNLGISDTKTFSSVCRSLEYKGPTTVDDTKVLIHNYGSVQYTSGSQRSLVSPTHPDADGELAIQFIVKKDFQPANNEKVYFRVTDPADPSSYVNNPHVGDNLGGDKPNNIPAILGGNGTIPDSGVWSNMSGTDGVVQVTLQIPGSASNPISTSNPFAGAGDNYIIEASLTSSFSPIVASSKVTAWKRVYLERDQMFRKGAYIDQVASTGSDRVHVTDRTQFSARKQVRLIHAPRRDGVPPAQGPDGFWFEDLTVSSIARDSSGDGGTLIFAQTLTYTYTPDASFTTPPDNPITYLDDAAGLITGTNSNDFFLLQDNLNVKTLFDTAYVEFTDATQNVPYFPFEGNIGDTNHGGASEGGASGHMAIKWFENATRDPLNPTKQIAKPNHQHLIGASKVPDTPIPGSTLNTAHLGDTCPISVCGTTDFSYIWTLRHEEIFHSNADKAKGETTAHELAHQWSVNPPLQTTGGHCNQNMKANAAKLCTMHGNLGGQANSSQMYDGIVGFHYVVSGSNVDSEYRTIREQPDPIQ